MPRRLPGRAIQAGTITVTQLETSVANTVQTGGGPKITNVEVTSNSYVVLDDTAVDIAGGYIKITGTGFAAGCQVLINNTPATSTTFIGPTEVRAQLPATAAGTYMLYLINADGGVAIRVNGVTFSATPSWVTASDLTSYALGDAISIQLAATGASTFALAAGSTLPTGLTLSAGGLLSGSVTGLENDTSYSFTITATDAENQDSPRTFTITITVQLQVSRSLRFNSADQAYLIRTPATAGNRRTWTWSCWIKKTRNGTFDPFFSGWVDTSNRMYLSFSSADKLQSFCRIGGVDQLEILTNAVFRDNSSWYHVVYACDTTLATGTDRLKIWVNGQQQTLAWTTTPAQNTELYINSAVNHYIGQHGGGDYSSYMLAESYFIDGSALTPSSFAETNNTTGQYIPKKYTGTYGTNGFYLPFTDNSSVLNLGRNYQPLTTDPFWPQTVLLLNGTGTNNAQNNTFTDSSTNAFAITRNGNVSQGRFSPFTQGGWSNYFDGTGDYLGVPSNAAFDFSTNDFTFEYWFFQTARANLQAPLAQMPNDSNGVWRLSVNNGSAADGIQFVVRVAGSWVTVVDVAAGWGIGTWNHLAVSRSGTTVRAFANGILLSTVTFSSAVGGSTYAPAVGYIGHDNVYFSGYVSNARIVKGTAVYTAAFTPPTTPLTAISGTSLLTCQSNRFIDNSTNNFTITRNGDTSVTAFSPFVPTTAYSAATHGGSAYFDGSGDYLTAGNGASETNLSGDSSIELWFYPLATNKVITAKYSGGTNQFFINADSSNKIYAEYLGSTYYAKTSSGSYTLNAWNHLLITKSGTLAKMWLNGVYEGSWTVSSVNSSTNAIGIGGTTIGGTSFYGYLGGIKYSNLAVETGTNNITVPTTPLTTGAGTVLLLNFTNAGIQDATGDNNIETVGDAKISTAQSKWAGSSMAFDGTGDYLYSPSSNLYNIASGDFTIEAWVYRSSTQISTYPRILAIGNANYNSLVFWTNGTGIWVTASTNGTTWVDMTFGTITNNIWTHLALVRNSSTITLYQNGVAHGTTYSYSTFVIPTPVLTVGTWAYSPTDSYWTGYIQDVRITRAARYTGTFTPPTAQFAYNQGDINYNQWVPTNFSVTAGAGNDSLLDVPTNWGVDTGLGGEVRGNYCTWNPLNATSASTANGNLETTLSGNAGFSGQIRGSMANLSGKWYWESVVTADGNQSHWIGVIGASSRYDIRLDNSNTLNQVLYARYDGQKIVNGTISAYGASYIVGDVIGIALDLDIGIVTFYKNNVSQGAISLPTTGIAYTPVFWYSTTATSGTIASNFGQRPFAYAAPSGFKSLNTHNLPALAVAKSNTAFDAVTWTGDGNTTRSITGLQFSPDLLWYKNRSVAVNNYINDTIRGAGAGTHMHTNTTDTEASASVYATNGGLQSFDANGFTGYKGSDATYQAFNLLNNNYVAWAWDAGTTTVVNTAGSISANVRVNASAGISIATFATLAGGGGTFGHGLGVAPKFIIQKSRTSAQDWYVYHASLGASAYMLLNSSAASVSSTAVWGGTTPSSAIVTLGSGWINTNHGNVVAYCFAEVPGFSAFGNYTGNNSTDGSFVYTGFRPAFVMIKSYSGAFDQAYASWTIYDNKRNPTNKATNPLFANLSAAEGARGNGSSQPNVLDIDLLSNGFKLRASAAESNYGSFIYAAFAESPFKYARAR